MIRSKTTLIIYAIAHVIVFSAVIILLLSALGGVESGNVETLTDQANGHRNRAIDIEEVAKQYNENISQIDEATESMNTSQRNKTMLRLDGPNVLVGDHHPLHWYNENIEIQKTTIQTLEANNKELLSGVIENPNQDDESHILSTLQEEVIKQKQLAAEAEELRSNRQESQTNTDKILSWAAGLGGFFAPLSFGYLKMRSSAIGSKQKESHTTPAQKENKLLTGLEWACLISMFALAFVGIFDLGSRNFVIGLYLVSALYSSILLACACHDQMKLERFLDTTNTPSATEVLASCRWRRIPFYKMLQLPEQPNQTSAE